MVTRDRDDDKKEIEISATPTTVEIVRVAENAYQLAFLRDIDAMLTALERDSEEIKEFLKTHKIR